MDKTISKEFFSNILHHSLLNTDTIIDNLADSPASQEKQVVDCSGWSRRCGDQFDVEGSGKNSQDMTKLSLQTEVWPTSSPSRLSGLSGPEREDWYQRYGDKFELLYSESTERVHDSAPTVHTYLEKNEILSGGEVATEIFADNDVAEVIQSVGRVTEVTAGFMVQTSVSSEQEERQLELSVYGSEFQLELSASKPKPSSSVPRDRSLRRSRVLSTISRLSVAAPEVNILYLNSFLHQLDLLRYRASVLMHSKLRTFNRLLAFACKWQKFTQQTRDLIFKVSAKIADLSSGCCYGNKIEVTVVSPWQLMKQFLVRIPSSLSTSSFDVSLSSLALIDTKLNSFFLVVCLCMKMFVLGKLVTQRSQRTVCSTV